MIYHVEEPRFAGAVHRFVRGALVQSDADTARILRHAAAPSNIAPEIGHGSLRALDRDHTFGVNVAPNEISGAN